MASFICGSISYIDSPKFVIEYVCERCTQKSHKFLIIAPTTVTSNLDRNNYESFTEYSNICDYNENAYIKTFVETLLEELLKNEKYYVYYSAKEKAQISSYCHIEKHSYICIEKTYKFVSKIIVVSYDAINNLNGYEEQYLERNYQLIEI